MKTKNIGKITQIVGPVVDVYFENSTPAIFDALRKENLILEVQQQLGQGVVRAIAMGATEGLSRGDEVESLGEPITVPVGKPTLGRIINVLGEPADGREKLIS